MDTLENNFFTEINTMPNLFADFYFNALNAKDFKEDSVREVLILPISKERDGEPRVKVIWRGLKRLKDITDT